MIELNDRRRRRGRGRAERTEKLNALDEPALRRAVRGVRRGRGGRRRRARARARAARRRAGVCAGRDISGVDPRDDDVPALPSAGLVEPLIMWNTTPVWRDWSKCRPCRTTTSKRSSDGQAP